MKISQPQSSLIRSSLIQSSLMQSSLMLLAVIAGTFAPPASAQVDEFASTRAIHSMRSAPTAQAGSTDDFQQAIIKYQKGDKDGALIGFNKAILKDPTNVMAWLYRGFVRCDKGDYVNAMSDYDQNHIAGMESMVLSEKGACQIQMWDLKSAESNLSRSLSLDSTSNDALLAYTRRAEARRLMSNFVGALIDCNAALKINPTMYDAHWQRGACLYSIHRYADAIPDFQGVVRVEPGFAKAHFLLGECFRLTNRKTDAMSEYNIAADLFSKQNDVNNWTQTIKLINALNGRSTDAQGDTVVPKNRSIESSDHSEMKVRSVETTAYTSKEKKAQLVGLVLDVSGNWYLQTKAGKRPINTRGASVFEGETPIRASKDGTLTVACINSTRATCPGNHKIGEPFILRQKEAVDDWWRELVPFLTNYGTWIFPVARGLDGPVSLHDAVCYVNQSERKWNLTDSLNSLPDGEYRVTLQKFSDADAKPSPNSIDLNVIIRGGTAVGLADSKNTNQEASATDASLSGAYILQIRSVSKNVEIDPSTLNSALIDVTTDAKTYVTHKRLFETALQKTSSWNSNDQSRRILMRSILVAMSKVSASQIEWLFRVKPQPFLKSR
ncbi:MAG TPA: tetratricopeptide repeat protein [Drouetiella sp.]